jgi:hypothetical protein
LQIKHSFTHFGIAWRYKENGIWNIVNAPPYGWVADPFLVEYQGKLFLFAEIFLFKSERNGVIGYCTFDGNAFGEWTVTMDRHWHLSYPFVFVENGRINMCPETWQLGEVVIYELQEFPDKWKKKMSLISDVSYCDSTFFEYTNEKWMFTYRRPYDNCCAAGMIYRCDDNHVLSDGRVFSESEENYRCGGSVIYEDGKTIRVAQNGIPYYGKELIFYEIDSVWPEYKEHEIMRMCSDDILINGFSRHTGIHTYNRLGDIEVIDFRYQSYKLKDVFDENRAISHTHKVFLNKYRG